MSENGKKKEWYENILDTMEEIIPQILSSPASKQRLADVGNILRDSFVPEGVRGGVETRLDKMYEQLGESQDARSAKKYLQRLTDNIMLGYVRTSNIGGIDMTARNRTSPRN